MQYSVSIHGTATRMEAPGAVESILTVGWGTVITLKRPEPRQIGDLPTLIEHPGGWFHITLPLTLTLADAGKVRLESITLFGEAKYCRISRVHVWDGADLLEQFDHLKLKGEFYNGSAITFSKPHRVSSGLGISFYACAFQEDYYRDDSGRRWDIKFDGPLPSAVLILSAAGVQVRVPDPPSILVTDLVKDFVKRFNP